MWRSLLWVCLGSVALAGACSSSTTNEGSATGGASTGGASTGGANSGGASTGGAAGSSTGGAPGGGAGGSATGGSGGGDAGLVCPPGTKGPALAPVGSSFCIDATEVTNDHYQAFLADIADGGPMNLTGLSVCANAIDYKPPSGDPCPPFVPGTDKNFPVRCVDWCSAYAYCKWAGKRLCGAKGGGPASASLPDADADQWHSACAGPGGADKYFYGDQHEGGRCIDTTQVAPVGSTMGQQKPCSSHYYKTVTDMLGNVAEWEDACSGADCLTRGGSASDGGPGVTCATPKPVPRTKKLPEVGFRCCWDDSVGK